MEERRDPLLPAADPALEMSSADLFWEEHWKKFAGALAALVVAILLVGAWMLYSSHVRSSAEALLSLAETPEALRNVVDRYPGSVPAGNALLRLAAMSRDEGSVEKASEDLETFVGSYSGHPLIGAGWLALGGVRELQGNTDAALEAYRTASGSYPKSYAAPLALLSEAKLISAKGASGEARAILESISVSYPGTPAAMVAAAEVARISPRPVDEPAASSPAGTP
jgi:predicted negative regulator of RcsB-dependent stress response